MKDQPMTLQQFHELNIANYALKESKEGKYYICIIRHKGDPPLTEFPDLSKSVIYEITEGLYNYLIEA